MIFEPQKYSFIFQDAIYSLAVGFLAGLINRLLSAFTGNGKIRLFFKDVFMCIVFAVLIFSYSVSFANYRVLRWYNVAVALAGFVLFLPAIDSAARAVTGIAAVTVKYLAGKAAAGAAAAFRRKCEKIAEKRQKFPQKTDRELLKQQDIILYN